jgi:transcriptional regulator with XRE-family HTH domain
LTWARETAGLSLEEAADALGINPARGRSAVERLHAFENGEEEPSRPTLLKMTKAYRRPLVAFYLAEPPRKGDRGQDFRTLPGREQYNPELDALVRDIKARQGLIRSMLEDNDAATVDFVGSVKVDYPIERLTAKIEGAGVFVLLLGNLGSYHTNIPVEVFRGFALADPLAPLIVINDLDARAAWSFTALHELAHLWLGATGISGPTNTNNIIEQYCNDVAGEILFPSSAVQEFAKLPIASSLERAADDRRIC